MSLVPGWLLDVVLRHGRVLVNGPCPGGTIHAGAWGGIGWGHFLVLVGDAGVPTRGGGFETVFPRGTLLFVEGRGASRMK